MVGDFRVKMVDLVGKDGVIKLNLIFLLVIDFGCIILVWSDLVYSISI